MALSMTTEWPCAMSMTMTSTSGAHELGGALEIVAGRADGGADAEPALLVASRERQAPLTQEVARGDQPEQATVVSDERQLLDLALDHQLLGVHEAQRASMHDEPIDRRHAVRHAHVGAVHEADVALGQQTRQPPLVVHDDERADARLAHLGCRLRQRAGRRHAVWIGDHAVLRALDDLHLADLRLDLARPEAAIDDADASFLGLNDRHRRPSDRVHVGRHDRPLEPDAARQPARQIDCRGIPPRQHAVLRRQDEVVERAAAHQLQNRTPGALVDLWESGSHWNYRYSRRLAGSGNSATLRDYRNASSANG